MQGGATMQDTYRETWKEICFILSGQTNVSESVYEQKVIMALEKIGWSQFQGEIKQQPSLPVGSRSTIRPDIVIYRPKGKALVAIEVKKPAEKITGFEQLKSYMRQTKSDFGLLVGEEIRVYYDGRANPHSEPLQLEKVSFKPDSSAGQRFVEIFTKSNFLDGNYRSYLEKKISRFNEKQEIDKLRKNICSDATKEKILEFLTSEYAESGQDIVSEAMKDLKLKLYYEDIEATPVKPNAPRVPPPSGRRKTPTPPAQEWVRKVPELLKEDNLRTWKAICDYLGLDVSGNSARRVLEKWVNQNKPGWPEVPKPASDHTVKK
jgi:hypothetical protein